jgi:Rrf2 family protein
MHITLEADYAVRIVEHLAQRGEKLDAHTISENTRVPQRFALKILRKLVQQGLIKSYKGAKGGYQLSRAPSKITLREVIEAVEGPYVLSRCLQDAYCCEHTTCQFHRIYDEISLLVREKLETVTFAREEDPSGCSKQGPEADPNDILNE